jgi:hypothetical protein
MAIGWLCHPDKVLPYYYPACKTLPMPPSYTATCYSNSLSPATLREETPETWKQIYPPIQTLIMMFRYIPLIRS